jgi:Na+/H+-dicarboxylate symporter
MVDWLLDRFRTAVNCFGDSVGAAIVDGVMKEADGAEEEPDDEALVPEGVGS